MSSDLKNKLLLLVIVLIAFVDGLLVMNHAQSDSTSQTPTPTQLEPVTDPFTEKTPLTTEPAIFTKSVPFTTQAPTGYWTEKPWADFAEEACVYMAYKWGVSAEMPDRNTVADNLKALGDWEGKQFGTSALTDIPQTLKMLTDALGHSKASLSTDVSESALKAALDQGTILIIPVNGQLLKNRYYGDPAPKNHMIVVYDYNEKGFLSNDPGTSRGEAYVYEFQRLLDSIQDLGGEKRLILVSR